MAMRAFITFLAVASETRSTNTGACRLAMISAMPMGKPSLAALRPPGVVTVFWPMMVVGAICPPVMP
jgi:hypothetical protein